MSIDDFLFLFDIYNDKNYFFGPVDRDYAVRPEESQTNTTAQMLSVEQLREESIVDDVLRVLKKTGMPGDVLTAEITEYIPVEEAEKIASVLEGFKSAGIQIAIDDFGTGYSNLAHLKQLNVDEIKIDRMFVKDIEEDTYNFQLVSNTLDFANESSIRVCCEGVETPRVLVVLESRSPDLIQGYLFDKPCSVAEFEEVYIDAGSERFKKRIEFVKELYEYKGTTGVLNFDPKDILRETNVGLWVIRINTQNGKCEMHADSTMERIMGVDKKYTPHQCYDFWYGRISNEHIDYVEKNVRLMTQIDKVVQLRYPWNHPEYGEVIVGCTGKRTKDSDGMIVLKGY